MIFRELKAGFPIYLFDRASRKFKQGKVTTNPCPDFENGKQNVMAAMPGMPNYGARNVKVNVQTEDGKQSIYSVVDTEQTAYSDTLVISCSKESIINEVNALKNQANDIINKMPDFEQTVKDIFRRKHFYNSFYLFSHCCFYSSSCIIIACIFISK